MMFQIIQIGTEIIRTANEAKQNPCGLEGDLLFFFRDFKQSIDSKNMFSLQKLISDDYYSASFINKNKQQLIAYFQDFFEKVPSFASLALEIVICKMPEVRDQQIHIIIRPILHIQTLGITWLSGAFGTDDRMSILLQKDDASGLFNIVNMEQV
jgi:hypothetical protein